MKIHLFSMSSKQFLPLSEITFDKCKKPYAEKHGYSCSLLITETVEHYQNVLGYPYGFVRINEINRLLETDVEWIWSTGADVLITNPETKIESIVEQFEGYDMLVTMDVSHINDDSMLIKNTKWSKEYFKFLYDQRLSGVPDSQNLIIKTFQDHKQIKIIPQRLINAYQHRLIGHSPNHPGEWHKGDFALHLVNMSLERRIDIAKTYIK